MPKFLFPTHDRERKDKPRARREQREFTLYAEPKQLKDREAGLKSKDKNHQFFIVCYLKFY